MGSPTTPTHGKYEALYLGRDEMTSATEKFLSFINNKIDSFNKALTLDQMFLLQSAQRQIAEADRPDYIQAKRQSTVFGASIEGWQYNKIGADLAEFVSAAVS